jgi:hypothetical protein
MPAIDHAFLASEALPAITGEVLVEREQECEERCSYTPWVTPR